jgi:hypothetical protein
MKKSDKKFKWIEEAEAAFSQLKKVLSTPPVLVAPKEREPLLLYITATHQVVSTVLVVERSEEGKAHGVQQPVYFLNEFYHHRNNAIRITKNLRTTCSQQHGSYNSTSRCTQL